MNPTKSAPLLLWLVCFATARADVTSPPVSVVWQRSFAAGDYTAGFSVDADDSGNVLFGGYTTGDLSGPNAGNFDAVVTKLDSTGATLWSRQFGGAGSDQTLGVAYDNDGNAYATGRTTVFPGTASSGNFDAFLTKFAADGSIAWMQTLGSSVEDIARRAQADSLGNVYVYGETRGALTDQSAGERDVFLAKYNSSGHLLWTRQFGDTLDDLSHGMAVDNLGNVYVSGKRRGIRGEVEFLARYASDGNRSWEREVPGGITNAEVLAIDASGNVVIAGQSLGLGTPFLAKYDPAGTLQWLDPFSPAGPFRAAGVSINEDGSIFVANSSVPAVLAFDENGDMLWTLQIRDGQGGFVNDIAAGPNGSLYVPGRSGGLFSPDRTTKAFLVKLQVIPEASSLAMAALSFGLLLSGRKAPNTP